MSQLSDLKKLKRQALDWINVNQTGSLDVYTLDPWETQKMIEKYAHAVEQLVRGIELDEDEWLDED